MRAEARRIAQALDGDYVALEEPIGGLAGVCHDPTGLEFVVVPGGSFVMGMREDEEESFRERVFGGDVERYNAVVAKWHLPQMRPPRRVQVPSFLCARDLLKPSMAAGLAHTVIDDEMLFTPGQVPAVLMRFGWRLLSEAEWEWVARQGGARSWVIDVPEGVGGLDLDFCDDVRENGWGIRNQKSDQGEWVADAWHDSYEGAPADGRRWGGSGEVPGVHRGAHTCWQDDAEAVTCHVALRERAGEFQHGGVRLALDLPG